jgi:hypothetical protein
MRWPRFATSGPPTTQIEKAGRCVWPYGQASARSCSAYYCDVREGREARYKMPANAVTQAAIQISTALVPLSLAESFQSEAKWFRLRLVRISTTFC